MYIESKRINLELNIFSLKDYIDSALGPEPEPGAMNFTIVVEGFMDNITYFFYMCDGREDVAIPHEAPKMVRS